jgi:hypothetical protein
MSSNIKKKLFNDSIEEWDSRYDESDEFIYDYIISDYPINYEYKDLEDASHQLYRLGLDLSKISLPGLRVINYQSVYSIGKQRRIKIESILLEESENLNLVKIKKTN